MYTCVFPVTMQNEYFQIKLSFYNVRDFSEINVGKDFSQINLFLNIGTITSFKPLTKL